MAAALGEMEVDQPSRIPQPPPRPEPRNSNANVRPVQQPQQHRRPPSDIQAQQLAFQARQQAMAAQQQSQTVQQPQALTAAQLERMRRTAAVTTVRIKELDSQMRLAPATMRTLRRRLADPKTKVKTRSEFISQWNESADMLNAAVARANALGASDRSFPIRYLETALMRVRLNRAVAKVNNAAAQIWEVISKLEEEDEIYDSIANEDALTSDSYAMPGTSAEREDDDESLR